MTGNEASDSRQFETLLDLGPDVTPRGVITGKGYDAKANRDAARRRGICPIIPHRSNTRARPSFFPKRLYRLRAAQPVRAIAISRMVRRLARIIHDAPS